MRRSPRTPHGGYRVLARLRAAEARAQAGDPAAATATLEQLAANADSEPVYRSLGELLAAQRDFANAQPDALLAQLEPLGRDRRSVALQRARAARCWRRCRAATPPAARQTLDDLLADPLTPPHLGRRAAELLAFLGGPPAAGQPAAEAGEPPAAAASRRARAGASAGGSRRGGRLMGRRRFALAALIGLAACSSDDSWFGASEDPPLPGERVSVMLLEREVNADPSLANLPIQLPPPQVNAAWPQNGGNPTHVMNHLAAGDQLGLAWRASIGEGSPGQGQLLARPVIAEGRVFTMDGEATIRAFDARSGSVALAARAGRLTDGLIGGGLAYAGGRLFATLSSGDVVGLDAAKGTEVWRQSLGLPLRAAPTVAEGRVLVLTADNQLYALDAASGRPLWRHAGFFEGAGLLGGPSPAVDRGLVVVPYSSAEVYAIRLDNGRPLWSDTVERPRRTQALDQITDIEAMPVIDGEDVYIAGYGGQMAAIDVRRGIRRWDIDIASTETPWVAGDFIYVLTTRGEVVACCAPMAGSAGSVRCPGWSTRTIWARPRSSGPARFWSAIGCCVAGSHGEAITLSPYTGEILGRQELPGPVVVPPVAADGTVYIVTENAELLAYR